MGISFNTQKFPKIKEFKLYNHPDKGEILIGICRKDILNIDRLLCRMGNNMEKFIYIPENTILKNATANDLLNLDGVDIYRNVFDDRRVL